MGNDIREKLISDSGWHQGSSPKKVSSPKENTFHRFITWLKKSFNISQDSIAKIIDILEKTPVSGSFATEDQKIVLQLHTFSLSKKMKNIDPITKQFIINIRETLLDKNKQLEKALKLFRENIVDFKAPLGKPHSNITIDSLKEQAKALAKLGYSTEKDLLNLVDRETVFKQW